MRKYLLQDLFTGIALLNDQKDAKFRMLHADSSVRKATFSSQKLCSVRLYAKVGSSESSSKTLQKSVLLAKRCQEKSGQMIHGDARLLVGRQGYRFRRRRYCVTVTNLALEELRQQTIQRSIRGCRFVGSEESI